MTRLCAKQGSLHADLTPPKLKHTSKSTAMPVQLKEIKVLGKPVKSLISGFSSRQRDLNRQNQICWVTAGYHLFNRDIYFSNLYSLEPLILTRIFDMFHYFPLPFVCACIIQSHFRRHLGPDWFDN